MYDLTATQLLPKALRTEFVALFVEGDGNCAWRSLSQGIWDSQEYWPQAKLFVLAWSVLHAESLVDKGGILHKGDKHWPGEVAGKYETRCAEKDEASTAIHSFNILIASVAFYCAQNRWGSDLTMLLASQALRIKVKMLLPADQKSRKRYEALGHPPPHGTGRKGNNLDDHRHSHEFVPDSAQLVYHMRGEHGVERVIEEVVVALTDGYCSGGKDALGGIPEVDKDTACGEGIHFATISRTDDAFPSLPFPFHKVAPPLFAVMVSFLFVVYERTTHRLRHFR